MNSCLFLATVVACFFFTTLGISTQFAISALYWQEVWSVGPDVVGTIMAVGEGLGVCCLVVFAQPAVFNSPVTRYFGKPANVLMATMGMGTMCFLTTANNQIACAVGTVAIHMCNVCVHSFQAELVGLCTTGEHFGIWISRSYVVKRLANCVCVFGSLVFFDLFGPQASHQVVGSGLVVYAAGLFALYASMRVLPCQRLPVQAGSKRRAAMTLAKSGAEANGVAETLASPVKALEPKPQVHEEEDDCLPI